MLPIGSFFFPLIADPMSKDNNFKGRKIEEPPKLNLYQSFKIAKFSCHKYNKCFTVMNLKSKLFLSRGLRISWKPFISPSLMQWRSQKAEKVTHIKGRLLYQVVIRSLQLCPFSNWELLLKESICSQRE